MLLLVAVALFAAAFAAAVRAVPDAEVDVRWPLLAAAALVGVPLTIALNGAEYAATGAVVGQPVRWLAALRVSVLSSAANLLPVPGAVLVRARALHQLGTPYRRAFAATAVVGLAWLGVTGVLAGALLLGGGEEAALGGGLLGAGLAFVAVSHLAGASAAGASAGGASAGGASAGGGSAAATTARVVAVEVASVAVGALRYLLVIAGLGFDVTAVQAVALTVSAVLASAVGILPGGLGLRELIAAGLSPLVGLPAAVGLLGVAVDRLLGLPMLALLAGGFAVSTGRAGDAATPTAE